MGERVTKVTKDTLIPLALVITIVMGVWALATDRARALGAIEQHEKRISLIEDDIRLIRDGVQRIEKAVISNHREAMEATSIGSGSVKKGT